MNIHTEADYNRFSVEKGRRPAEEDNSRLLQTYQHIISELMIQAKENSRLTLREFLEKLELE